MTYVDGCFIQGCQRFQQGSFIIQRFAGIGYKNGRDTEGLAGSDLHYEGRGGRIPGGVTSCFKSGSQTTTGERGGIGLLLDQGCSVKFFDSCAIALYSKKGIVFFCSGAGNGLQPVCKVPNSFLF